MNKKGELRQIQPVILSLVIVGIILGIGLLVLSEFQSGLSTASATVNNETLTTVTEAGETVTTAGTCGFNSFAVTTATNATGGEIIASGNYTIDSDKGIVYSTGGTYNNSDWNVTYNYNYGQEGCEGVNATINAINKIPTWLPIIVILAIVGIILAIVFSVLPKAGGGISFGGGRAAGEVAEI